MNMAVCNAQAAFFVGLKNRDMTRISLEKRAVPTTLNFGFFTRGVRS
jgi:hypothetical protein